MVEKRGESWWLRRKRYKLVVEEKEVLVDG